MNARSLPAQPVDLLDRYHRLEPGGKLVMRLKSLTFPPVGKTAFLACLTRSGLRMPTGKAWSFAAAGVVLEALSAQRLLTPELACPAALLNAVAIDAVASAEGAALIEAVRRAFAEPRMPAYVSSTFADPEALIRLLRLAIYANDAQGFVEKRDALERTIAPRRAAGALATLFASEPLGPEWLSSRDPVIQLALVEAKIGSLLWTGIAPPDLPVLLAHYLPQQHTAAPAALRPILRHYALFAGRLDDARRGIAAIEDISGEISRAMQGAEAFLAGHNAAALVHYREALRLHRKRLGKRKIFLDDEHGLLFLLALLAAHDAALHPDIQTALDLAIAQPTLYAGGMLAIQALLWMAQGLQAKAAELLGKLRARMPGEPLSAACVCLAEHALGAARSKAQREDMLRRFEALEHHLPLIARIHAEILAADAATPGRFAAFLAATQGRCAIAFTRIIQLRQPWERALESLDAFLGAGASEPARAAARTKRLAWFLDPATQQIEVAEQSARGTGWSDGRPVAMKRLHEQDPRLDYLTPQDRAALRAIRKESGGWYGEELYTFDPLRAIPALIGHPAVFDARRRAQPLDLIAYPLELVVSEQRDGYRVVLSHSAEAPCVFLEAETPQRYRVVTFPQHLLALQEILGKRGLTVPKTARDQVIAMVRRDNPALPIRAEIAEIEAPGIAAQSMPVVQLMRQDEGLRIALMVRPFGPEGPSYVAGLGGRSVLASIAGQPMRANRDLAREVAERAALIETCPTLREHGGADAHEVVVETLERGLDLLLELRAYAGPLAIEWPHGNTMRVSEVDPHKLRMRVGQDRGWFSIDGAITLDDEQVVEMRYLLDRLDRTNGTAKGRFVPLEDGRFLALTQQLQAQLQQLAAVSEPHRGGRRVHALAAPTLDAVLEEAGEVKADAAWKRHIARIRGAEGFTPAIPANLQAELRDYQIAGFVWMSRLARWGAGACLADDMGLGKTVQAIAVMLERAGEGPSLVVAPTSVCANWEAEIARFAPTLATHRLAAPADRAGLIAGLGARDVLITSYGLLHQESEALAGRAWQVVVLDEAQAIKNAQTKRAQASLALQAGLRIALTGTPVENYLDELWSLFNFVNPGLLGSRDGFQRRFAVPIERDRDPQARAALRALLRPFLLRRTKAAVLSELPPRTEQTIQVEMGDAERAFYEALRQCALETIAALDSAPGKRKLHILAEITRLRRACCNPALIDAAAALPAAKQEAFLELVEELIRNRHRALVFSQFVGHLTLIRAALDERGIGYEYLDGGTPPAERARRVTAFQNGAAPLFLISLRAGGTGLNLTAADYVVHLDPWWNPAVEDQASDRAHRIGQQRPVTVYRLIMQDSIEQRILRLHADKRDLATELLEGAEVSARLSEEALLDLIRR